MTRSLLLALLLTLSACLGPARPATVALQVLPEAGAQPLLRALDGATRSIDLEVYLLAHPEVITALRAARARGARVRVLLEERPFGTATNVETYAELQRGGVEVRWTDPALRYSHAKLLLVDGTQAWVMTANLTRAAFASNREYLALLTDPTDVAELGALFEADWARMPHAPRSHTLVAAPHNARERIAALISSAQSSLDVAAEELVDAAAIRPLGEAAARGVTVRVLMSGEPTDSSAAGRAALVRAGVGVRLLAKPYIHAKLILADDTRLYVGSVNLSARSLDRNREVGVLLSSRPVLELAKSTFE